MIEFYEFDTSHFLRQEWNKNNFDYSRFRKGVSLKNGTVIQALTFKRGHRCECCGLSTWNDVPIPLQVHHKDGDRLNLYYYNDKTGKIETIKSNIMVSGGYVTFDITHCSDYFLTMSVVKNAERANNNGVIIIGMLVIIVGLVGYTIFKNTNN